MKIASEKADATVTPYLKTYKEENGLTVHVVAGDFSEIMSKVVKNLEKSFEFAANENERNMIKDYIEHFRFGE